MAKFSGHGIAWDALALAPVAPIICSNNPAGKSGTGRANALPGHLEPEADQAAESSQVMALTEGSVEQECIAVENEI
nr:hypothetical protein J0916_05265 [Arthrobacter polaris]